MSGEDTASVSKVSSNISNCCNSIHSIFRGFLSLKMVSNQTKHTLQAKIMILLWPIYGIKSTGPYGLHLIGNIRFAQISKIYYSFNQ